MVKKNEGGLIFNFYYVYLGLWRVKVVKRKEK
jgi:hypothetical protein